jgi:hypothetical protein
MQYETIVSNLSIPADFTEGNIRERSTQGPGILRVGELQYMRP